MIEGLTLLWPLFLPLGFAHQFSGKSFPGLARAACSLRVSIAVKRTFDHGNFYKGQHLIEMSQVQFRDSVHDHHGRELGGVQAEMVLAVY